MNAGIDYSRGTANRNIETGIHFGVISTHSLASWVFDEAEPVYPETIEVTCPTCRVLFDTSAQDDFTCPECEHTWQDFDAWEFVEPESWDYSPNDSDYTTEYSESLCCIFITKSPYFTYGNFCSPCAPGAVDLDSPNPDGAKAYCFGLDYFDEENPCPYPVYRVDTSEEVKA